MTAMRFNIFPLLVTIFLIVPIIEIYLLIKIGGIIGVLSTIACVVLTALMGAALLRNQGMQTYMRFNQSLAEGRMPAGEILEGVALLIGGALLLTPGFFTDTIGFICLLPFTRLPLVRHLVKRFNPLASMQKNHPNQATSFGNLYEGEVTRHHEDP